MLEQFETAVKKHGEALIWDVLDNWERYNRVPDVHTMTLEERWARFIRETNPSPAEAT